MATTSAQPKLKKQRKNPPGELSDDASHTPSAAAHLHSAVDGLNGNGSGASSSKLAGSSAAGLAAANYARTSASSSKLTAASVREFIAGQEREVIVLSDGEDDAPPARPLAADSYNDDGTRRRNGVNGVVASTKGRYRAPTDDTAGAAAKGKRKAGSNDVELVETNAALALVDGTKRRRRDEPLPVPQLQRTAYDQYGGNGAALAQPEADPYGASSLARPAQQDYRAVAKAPLEYVVPKFVPPALPVDDKEGHFIVRKGENVSDRYKIMQQLGQGTFGKVVECWDRQRQCYVAIKIIRAIQKYRDASQIEIRVLRTLSEADPKNENKCIHLIDTFCYRNHVCIVSELLGQSVFDFLKENQFASFPPRHIWSFAKQLLQSVAFLHRLNLVHTDLKPENILLVQSDYENVPLSKRANARRKRVLKNSEIRLIDFGSATFDHEYHSQVVSTRHYRAPEIILQMGWTFPCDAWSIGCILVEFFTGDALFQTHDNLEHLAMMEVVLGPMPEEYRRKAATYKPDYFRGGKLNYPNAETAPQSKRYMKRMKRLQDIVSGPAAFSKHNARFLHLLQRLLAWDPSQRMKVADALNHPYFDLVDSEFPGPPCPNSASA